MFWWFERKGVFLRCEAGPGTAGGFELRVIQPDGTEQVERFTDSTNLAERQEKVIEQITHDGWSGPHGWNV
jgi:hypothetical protein